MNWNWLKRANERAVVQRTNTSPGIPGKPKEDRNLVDIE
jgi:hypothetical protein